MSTYHHGDLRNTLIQIGTEMLQETGAEALSLRKLAKRAGVSHNAPYQHFADKEALFAAIAQEGFRLLGEAMDTVAHIPDPKVRLRTTCSVYVTFALHHAGHLQVMFGTLPQSQYPELAQTALETLGKLEAVIQAGQAAGVFRAGDTREIATVAWMLVQGLSTALIAQKIPPGVIGERDADRLAQDFVQMLCDGLAIS